ncbi:MAG: polysaccharide deacetylase family protein [Deltaproteobacteria bacterium]|nr:polysaccharide deacetylase family protein [Deltaproteobacteria bacterium]
MGLSVGSSVSLPVLAYHDVSLGGDRRRQRLETHLAALARSGLPSLAPQDLETAARGYLLTFDDGFVDLWTHGLARLERHGVKATVFAIPARADGGDLRPTGAPAFNGTPSQAHGEAARRGGPHPGFLRWSELSALERSGLVTVQSHSWSHAMGWVGDKILGFHLGCAHWSLAQATGGDERPGIPLYRRGSALGHALFFDPPELRDELTEWLERAGGEAYLRAEGARRVGKRLRALAEAHRGRHPNGGRWETREEREARTLEEIVRARDELERRLGGTRDELCLPWGEYDEVTLECARRAGIRRVYTLDRGPNPTGRVGFRVNRFEPRMRGPLWLRTRLWIYRSTWRAGLYGRLTRR